MDVTPLAPWRRTLNRWLTASADAVARFCMRQWLLVLNVLLGALLGVAVLVPVLYALGADTLAMRIFQAYHLICAQIPSHSYFVLGYQLALCARNLAIYGSMFVGTLLFRAVRGWLPAISWQWWLVSMLPMALDGGTQLFGWRESNWELRTLTGAIFGLGVCWFLLPMLEAAAQGHDGPQNRIRLPPRRTVAIQPVASSVR